ncbi:MAG: hypothetical protein NVSMB27_21520 [Ktedonobacteraceae bacterium]
MDCIEVPADEGGGPRVTTHTASRMFSNSRSDVLQFTGLSPFTPSQKGHARRFDRAAGSTDHSTYWSSVSVVFRWRPEIDHVDWVSDHTALTIHILH